MDLRKWIGVVISIASIVAAAAWTQAQAPNAQQQSATVISGTDVGFRVESWNGSIPVGRWVVRSPVAGGQWVEPKVQTGVKQLQSK